jgi:hypothetical protein
MFQECCECNRRAFIGVPEHTKDRTGVTRGTVWYCRKHYDNLTRKPMKFRPKDRVWIWKHKDVVTAFNFERVIYA